MPSSLNNVGSPSSKNFIDVRDSLFSLNEVGASQPFPTPHPNPDPDPFPNPGPIPNPSPPTPPQPPPTRPPVPKIGKPR
jgi:hypothetical protein